VLDPIVRLAAIAGTSIPTTLTYSLQFGIPYTSVWVPGGTFDRQPVLSMSVAPFYANPATPARITINGQTIDFIGERAGFPPTPTTTTPPPVLRSDTFIFNSSVLIPVSFPAYNNLTVTPAAPGLAGALWVGRVTLLYSIIYHVVQ
jgi:hypothetical protein